MDRPRPRIEGKPNARTAGQPIQSQAPKDARLVPQQLSQLNSPRALAARQMLKKNPSRIPQKSNGTYATRACDGTLKDSGNEL